VVPHGLDTQQFQFGQDLRLHIARIDRAEQVLGHDLDDPGPFRIAIGKLSQDDERVVAGWRRRSCRPLQSNKVESF